MAMIQKIKNVVVGFVHEVYALILWPTMHLHAWDII
jgi:hypothetical protein